jgi:hypothetical protein
MWPPQQGLLPHLGDVLYTPDRRLGSGYPVPSTGTWGGILKIPSSEPIHLAETDSLDVGLRCDVGESKHPE